MWRAVNEQVAASTQNQALSALLFLYRVVLEFDGPGSVRSQADRMQKRETLRSISEKSRPVPRSRSVE